MAVNRVLLDTSAYSAFFRGHAGIGEAIQRAEEIYFTPVVLGELYSGFWRGRRRAQNQREFDEFVSSPRVKLVTIDEETSERYAAILQDLRREGKPIPTNDVWIAASAMQYGLSVLTTDRDFLSVRQILVSLF